MEKPTLKIEIIKSTPFKARKCAYGEFGIIPINGWKISQTFIDYESKLLVVTVAITDPSKWIQNNFGNTIPTKEYKIDLRSLKILSPNEWQKYFNYEPSETFSEDKKYRLVSQRIYDPEKFSDFIKEQLYDHSTTELLSSGTAKAFNEHNRENLLETHYRFEREKQEQKKRLDAKPTLEQYCLMQVDQLKENDIVITYYNETNTFKLQFTQSKFDLLQGGKLPASTTEFISIPFKKINTYNTADAFWLEFTDNKKWFLSFQPHKVLSEKPLVLAKQVNGFFNALRRSHAFTYAEYAKINQWSMLVWSDEYKSTEVKQWCAHCYKEVYYQARYPKYICGKCAAKEKRDADGNYLSFSNQGFSGGFKIIFKDGSGNIIKEDDSQLFCDCIIEGKVYVAQEAKFGGIVIIKKE